MPYIAYKYVEENRPIYVGYTTNLPRRDAEHRRDPRFQKHPGAKLYYVECQNSADAHRIEDILSTKYEDTLIGGDRRVKNTIMDRDSLPDSFQWIQYQAAAQGAQNKKRKSPYRRKKTEGLAVKVAISPYQGNERRNFTIAHELGHLFLHMGYLISKDTWDQQSNSCQFARFGANEQEYQANEFATALLMPQKEFKEKIEEYSSGNFVNMAQVANYFYVSISAATNHGRFLGYLQ